MKLWKVADFDITSAGMSTAMTTYYARGTSGYRPPELLNYEHPEFNTRSDIWALGCILHVLATGHRAFQDDTATTVYYREDPLPELTVHISCDNKFCQDQIAYCVRHFLSKEPLERPNANLASRRLAAYCMLLELPELELLTHASSSPPYFEWENVVKSGVSMVELLFELSKWYLRNGHSGVDWPLIIPKIIQTQRSGKASDDGEFWLQTTRLLREIGESLIDKNDYEAADFIFTGLVHNAPKSVHTSIVGAAMDGDIFSVNMLLKRGEDADKGDSRYPGTALHWAARKGDENVVEILLQHHANVDKQSHDGATALAWAVRQGHEKVVEMLLQHNANVNQRANNGVPALNWAVREGYEQVVEMLLQHNADVNQRDNNGVSALHWAAKQGYEKVVEMLLQHNADVNLRDNNGVPALHWASEARA